MEFLAGSSPWKRPTRTEHQYFFFLDVLVVVPMPILCDFFLYLAFIRQLSKINL